MPIDTNFLLHLERMWRYIEMGVASWGLPGGGAFLKHLLFLAIDFRTINAKRTYLVGAFLTVGVLGLCLMTVGDRPATALGDNSSGVYRQVTRTLSILWLLLFFEDRHEWVICSKETSLQFNANPSPMSLHCIAERKSRKSRSNGQAHNSKLLKSSFVWTPCPVRMPIEPAIFGICIQWNSMGENWNHPWTGSLCALHKFQPLQISKPNDLQTLMQTEFPSFFQFAWFKCRIFIDTFIDAFLL